MFVASKCTIYETLSSNCPYNEPVRLRTCELSFPIHHHPQSSAQYSPRMCADTLRTQDTTCQYPGCQRSVWQDPDGSYSSYCGTTHRDAMKLLNSEESVQLCKVRIYRVCCRTPVNTASRTAHRGQHTSQTAAVRG
ncbi:uncharacterized protein C8Q71DRAFT_379538 [Rhodofomes roseus]|uniref:Uncharacterized protein n=1 Tax=Rhodofomes roseus TaxID=34475 RepID=A0ABQ8K0Z0_9APHY|nr:uncharacterized protein C8Q71DRAFT_379538 [Rhodofomes roseus]KAH9830133.1 hypothetical protein C8Q71DRAFT_379538 [Rhodofomes roseus]